MVRCGRGGRWMVMGGKMWGCRSGVVQSLRRARAPETLIRVSAGVGRHVVTGVTGFVTGFVTGLLNRNSLIRRMISRVVTGVTGFS